MENKLDAAPLYSCVPGRSHLELGLKPGIATTKAWSGLQRGLESSTAKGSVPGEGGLRVMKISH